MNKILFILILFLPKVHFGQPSSYSVSTKDSADVVAFWKKIVAALDKGDIKTIQDNSVKVVDCFCGTEDSTKLKDKWPADKFAVQFIKKYSNTKKLQNIIQTNPVHVMLSANNKGKSKSIFSVSYQLDKPNEVAPGHEGTGIFFDFIKTKNSFKIYSIWTIP